MIRLTVVMNDSHTGWVVRDKTTGEQVSPPAPRFWGNKRRATIEAKRLRQAMSTE